MHDLVRLTRRRWWLLMGLSLIGRFPKKAKFRGRKIGWWRREVLEWMSRDLNVARDTHDCLNNPRCTCRHPRQNCLPLELGDPRDAHRHRAGTSSDKSQSSRTRSGDPTGRAT
jgi:predicted DNA-binding transcriptional regulator AlpA